MRVVVRVRPENQAELGTRVVVRVLDGHALIFDPQEQVDDFFYQSVKQKQYNVVSKPNKNLQFKFNQVYNGFATNQDIYKESIQTILDGVLNGYNCSVFAYGATGAGKTFTMIGNEDDPGVTFLTMMDLYHRIDDLKNEKVVDVAISYLEVYNENIRDLLNSGSNLPIREDPQRGTVVAGLTFHKPKDADELLDLLKKGNRNRSQHPTDANAESSRSHAVFTVYVRQKDCTDQMMPCLAKLCMIDLAGSERATVVSANKGIRIREGANINKSLLALGNCINALANHKSKSYIPYRDSKLTRLLKDSLSGNCQTVMVAAVSPSVRHYEDTYNTLNYAKRAMSIHENAKQNVVGAESAINHYAKIIQELQQEVIQLKSQLKESKGLESHPPAVNMPSSSAVACDEIQAQHLKSLFEDFRKTQSELLFISRQVREVEFKIFQRHRRLEELALVSVSASHLARDLAKNDNVVFRMQKKHDRLLAKKQETSQRLVRIKNQLPPVVDDKSGINQMTDWLKLQHMHINMENQEQQCAQLKQLIRGFTHDYNHSSRLMTNLLKTVKRQYLILLGHGLGSSDVEEDYQEILKLTEGYKEVAWADSEVTGDVNMTFNIERFLNLEHDDDSAGACISRSECTRETCTILNETILKIKDLNDEGEPGTAPKLELSNYKEYSLIRKKDAVSSPTMENVSNDTFVLSPHTEEPFRVLSGMTLMKAAKLRSPKRLRPNSDVAHSASKVKRPALAENSLARNKVALKSTSCSEMSSFTINTEKGTMKGHSESFKMKCRQRKFSKVHPYYGSENRLKGMAGSTAAARRFSLIKHQKGQMSASTTRQQLKSTLSS